MERITFLLTAQEKRNLKIKALERDTTLSGLLRQALELTPQTKQTPQDRINEINDILAKNGMNMTPEERKALKIERERLKGA